MKFLKSENFFAIVFLAICIFSFLVFCNSSCSEQNETISSAKEAIKTDPLIKGKNNLPETDTTSQRVLLIGDSMAYTLLYRLGDYCLQNGHTMNVVSWVSASTKWFGDSDTLAYFINKYKATYVIFVIGSNELFIDRIKEMRIKEIKHIQEQMANVKSVWIGPPNWKEDSGINDLLAESAGAGRFFLSKKLTFKRIDHAHPNRESASMWMDSIASWIVHQSVYPIRFEYPTVKRLEPVKPLVLKPLFTTPIDTLADVHSAEIQKKE